MLPILLTYWPFIETLLKNNKKYLGNFGEELDISIQRNILSSINAIGTIILGAIFLNNNNNNMAFMATILYPIVYYIYDTYYLWFHKKNKGLPYIIHHLAAIYFIQCIYLYNNEMKNIMVLGLICIEISNLPLYYVYDFLKRNQVTNTKNIQYFEKLLQLKQIQLVIYGFFRIFVYGYIIYYYTKETIHQPILISSIYLIFFMGAYWLQHQIKGYYKTKNEYNDLLQKNNSLTFLE